MASVKKQSKERRGMAKDWYSPSSIRYTREEMAFGILHLDMLEKGVWPSEHKDTGYTGSKGSRNTKTKFLPAALFYAEITARLESTKESGEVLVWEIQHGMDEYELLSPPAKMALNYISGWRRRMPFSQWTAKTKWRNKNKVF